MNTKDGERVRQCTSVLFSGVSLGVGGGVGCAVLDGVGKGELKKTIQEISRLVLFGLVQYQIFPELSQNFP